MRKLKIDGCIFGWIVKFSSMQLLVDSNDSNLYYKRIIAL